MKIGRIERTLLIRWSAVSTILVAALWTLWRLRVGPLPTSDIHLPWPSDCGWLTFSLSRWSDVALTPPLLLAVWGLGRIRKHCLLKSYYDVSEGRDLAVGVGVALMAILSVGVCLSNDSIRGEWLEAMLVMAASIGLLFRLCADESWIGFNAGLWLAGTALVFTSLLVGPIQGTLWAILTAAAFLCGMSVGYALRLMALPFRFAVDWLAGVDLERKKELAAVEAALAKIERQPPPPSPLEDHDKLVAHLLATVSKLTALRADPEIAKALALRDERPAA